MAQALQLGEDVNQTKPMKNKNTYSLLVESQEKGRTIFENSIYALVILCTAISAFQFASNSVVLPGMSRTNNNSEAAVEMVAKAHVEQPVVANRG